LDSLVSAAVTRWPTHGLFNTLPSELKLGNLARKYGDHYQSCAWFNLVGKCNVPNCTRPHACPICASAHSAAFSASCRPSMFKIISPWPEFANCGNCCCKA
jgi:hypothetical protein